MSLVINHNMMAMNAARNLGMIYSRLAKSTQRLSSGLRINSAGDDAAGLAIRELMRADIKVIEQGIRNASDGISMIQTAEGAMAVIDEKLTRMKELAEQAATGTYTTVQREIMNSEYQAMAAEIDRIANATDFNQTKLLDGSLTAFHNGSGMKLHFGTGNSAAEDYYFVTIGDVRATETTGLQVGGEGDNDIWTNNTEFTQLQSVVNSANNGGSVAFFYNYGGSDAVTATTGASAITDTPSNLVGVFTAASGDSLQDLIDTINRGTAARVQLDFASGTTTAILNNAASAGNQQIVVGNINFTFHYSSATHATGDVNLDVAATSTCAIASAFVTALNDYSSADTFALAVDRDTVILFAKTNGTTGNSLAFRESGANADYQFTNIDTAVSASSGAFSMGGLNWVTAGYDYDGTNYQLRLEGYDRSDYYDVVFADTSALNVDGLDTLTGFAEADWAQTQNASGLATWDGAHIRTQSAAQAALAQLDSAILRKDIIRANLGAIQNRLENTITQLGIQAENLQSAESRISDVDVATEMTEFTRNNILAQAATAMLAQANGLAQLALSLMQ